MVEQKSKTEKTKLLKSMDNFTYVCGLKLPVRFSKKQIELVKLNGNASCRYYNKLVALDRDKYKLQRKLQLITDSLQEDSDPKSILQKTNLIESLEQEINHIKDLSKTKNARNIFRFLYSNNLDSTMISSTVQNYKAAWNMYRKVHNSGTPQFKKFNNEWAYSTTTMYAPKYKANPSLINGNIKFIDQFHIKLPKLGVVKLTRELGGFYWNNRDQIRIGTVTVRIMNDNHQFISMQIASDLNLAQQNVTNTHKEIGIDLNLDNFCTLSNGDVIETLKFYRQSEKAIKKHQAKVSKMRDKLVKVGKTKQEIENSKNYQKERQRLAQINNQVRNRRDYFLDNLAIGLIKKYDFIALEDLKGKNMLKNHALAKSITDSGWRTFIQKLQTKGTQYGKTVVLVDPRNTTQMCSDCGYVCGSDERSEKLTLSEREWTCANCHKHHIRDVNAAQNILAKAKAQVAKEK